MDTTSTKWTLRSHRWLDELTIETTWGSGSLTATLTTGWPTPPTSEQVAMALRGEPVGERRAGQQIRIKRLPGGRAFGVSMGKPTWWLPKIMLSKGSIGAGWLRLSAFYFWK